MKTLFSFFKRSCSMVAVAVFCFGMSSCEVMQGVLEGMVSYPTYGYGMSSGYSATGYSSGYATTTSYTSSSSSSSSTKTCSRCRGTAKCQSCNGTGKKYDYGTKSLTTHEKYIQNCGVCRGTGRCGVCDGKGSI